MHLNPKFLHDACQNQKFMNSYQRTNKNSGHKNLRCFPHCCGGHKKFTYCGSSVVIECKQHPSLDYVQVYGVFEEMDHPLFEKNQYVLKSTIVKDIKSSKNPFGKFMKGDYQLPTSYSLDPTEYKKTKRYEINGNRQCWHYGWISNKYQKDTKHCLTVYIFSEISSNTSKLQCIGFVCSPSFTISSRRRNILHSISSSKAKKKSSTITISPPTSSILHKRNSSATKVIPKNDTSMIYPSRKQQRSKVSTEEDSYTVEELLCLRKKFRKRSRDLEELFHAMFDHLDCNVQDVVTEVQGQLDHQKKHKNMQLQNSENLSTFSNASSTSTLDGNEESLDIDSLFNPVDAMYTIQQTMSEFFPTFRHELDYQNNTKESVVNESNNKSRILMALGGHIFCNDFSDKVKKFIHENSDAARKGYLIDRAFCNFLSMVEYEIDAFLVQYNTSLEKILIEIRHSQESEKSNEITKHASSQDEVANQFNTDLANSREEDDEPVGFIPFISQMREALLTAYSETGIPASVQSMNLGSELEYFNGHWKMEPTDSTVFRQFIQQVTCFPSIIVTMYEKQFKSCINKYSNGVICLQSTSAFMKKRMARYILDSQPHVTPVLLYGISTNIPFFGFYLGDYRAWYEPNMWIMEMHFWPTESSQNKRRRVTRVSLLENPNRIRHWTTLEIDFSESWPKYQSLDVSERIGYPGNWKMVADHTIYYSRG